ncbi:MAG: HD domain-containing protein [bacterium]|nr:HD domain-containing protein [bacterium]
MSRVRRWKGYYTDGIETVCEHTIQQLMIVRDLFDLEMEYGSPRGLDEVLLLRCALIHDNGEGVQGWDAPEPLKRHSVIGPALQQMEDDAMREGIIKPMPIRLAERLERDYALSGDLVSRNGRFFRASEVVGYTIRAVQQYRIGKNDPSSIARRLGYEVFVTQYENLWGWADEFASVRIMFDQFREEVEDALCNDEACVAYAAKVGKSDAIRAQIAARYGSPYVAGTVDKMVRRATED